MKPALLSTLLLVAGGIPCLAAPVGPEGMRDRLVGDLLTKVFAEDRESAPAAGRDLFLAVLASEAFEHKAVGPFDVYAYVEDGLARRSAARKAVKRAVEGLKPLLPLLDQFFGREQGIIGGHRFPVVLTQADVAEGEESFDRLLALLDACEDAGYSGFKPDLTVWTPSHRKEDTVFTWEVQLFNLAHEHIVQHEDGWYEHGIGYHMINTLVNRLFAKSTWGAAPPWLLNGLVDELDIEAYGDAWVAAGKEVVTTTSYAGRSQAGWSGFLPTGATPPPSLTGRSRLPPSVVSFEKKDEWLSREESTWRHWDALRKDLSSEAPVSLRAMAAGQSFEKRDRAYARCVTHLVLHALPDQAPGLLELLDVESHVARSGMRDGDPLPALFADMLGGLHDVDRIETMPMEDYLDSIDRADLEKKIRKLGGEGMLSIADHREQAFWLYRYGRVKSAARQELYGIIVEVEGYQQLQEWELIGKALDRATAAALEANPTFPKKTRQRRKVTKAFREALTD